MKPITRWDRFIYDEVSGGRNWQFNHIEDGHVSTPGPTPKCTEHIKMWNGGQWVAVHAWLTDELPPKMVYKGTTK